MFSKDPISVLPLSSHPTWIPSCSSQSIGSVTRAISRMPTLRFIPAGAKIEIDWQKLATPAATYRHTRTPFYNQLNANYFSFHPSFVWGIFSFLGLISKENCYSSDSYSYLLWAWGWANMELIPLHNSKHLWKLSIQQGAIHFGTSLRCRNNLSMCRKLVIQGGFWTCNSVKERSPYGWFHRHNFQVSLLIRNGGI